MPWTLIESETNDYTAADVAIMVNEERNTAYPDIAAAILGAGLTIVSSAFYTRHVQDISYNILNIIAALGFTITLGGVQLALQNNYSATRLKPILERIRDEGGEVRITTKVYEYTTSSGNSSTWKTETTYSYIG